MKSQYSGRTPLIADVNSARKSQGQPKARRPSADTQWGRGPRVRFPSPLAGPTSPRRPALRSGSCGAFLLLPVDAHPFSSFSAGPFPSLLLPSASFLFPCSPSRPGRPTAEPLTDGAPPARPAPAPASLEPPPTALTPRRRSRPEPPSRRRGVLSRDALYRHGASGARARTIEETRGTCAPRRGPSPEPRAEPVLARRHAWRVAGDGSTPTSGTSSR